MLGPFVATNIEPTYVETEDRIFTFRDWTIVSKDNMERDRNKEAVDSRPAGSENDMKKIADWAMCVECREPRIMWQSWRNCFRCGWCKADYTVEDAKKLDCMSETKHKEVHRKRAQVVREVSFIYEL